MTALRLVLLALALPGCFLSTIYETPWPAPAEQHSVKTADGWTIDVRHVAPTTQLHATPVIALHGIVTNGRNMDFDEQHSIARGLAARGFDVWVPSLRGTGPSEHRDFDGTHPEQFDFDAYADRDAPALVDFVRAKTGAKGVTWLGHSMGGLVGYAYLSRGGAGVTRLVTLGSPAKLRWSGRMEQTVRDLSFLAGAAAHAPLRTLTLTFVPVLGSMDTPLERMLITDANMRLDTWRSFLSVGVDDIPAPLLEQFAGWVDRDRFDSRDHTIDYFGGLSRVTIPSFVIAAKVDGIAPAWCVRPAFERLAGDKQWLVVGEGSGAQSDYNHMDLLLGERADAEVFAPIATFLGRYD